MFSDMGQVGRNLDVGHLEGGQGTCLNFGQSKGSATRSMLLCGTSTKSLYTLRPINGQDGPEVNIVKTLSAHKKKILVKQGSHGLQ